MSQDVWSAVDRYFNETLGLGDRALEGALQACAAAELPAINVTSAQGKLLNLLARLMGTRCILEIGTLGGYSTIWLARALPKDGRLITLEIEPRHADVAGKNLERAGVASLVDIRVGPALETLPAIAAEGAGPFDLVFIDADKPSNPDYFAWALKLARPGSLIVVDNVVQNGAVIDAESVDPSIQGVRRLMELVASERRVEATALQTVGGKGYDGFLIARVIDG